MRLITLIKCYNFLQLEWSNEINNFNKTAKNRGLIATPSYDQVNEPLYNSSINRWKNYEKNSKTFEKNEKLKKKIDIFNYF